MSKAYEIGFGKSITWSNIIVDDQAPKPLKETENCGFYPATPRKINQDKPQSGASRADDSDDEAMFPCNEPGCSSEFSTYGELEDHMQLGQHGTKESQESVYDRLRRQWISKFSALTLEPETSTVSNDTRQQSKVSNGPPSKGWALQKPKGGDKRFNDNVREYLTKRFELGELTGRKADPTQVSADIRTIKSDDGDRLFARDEWLTKTQIKGFFSRLAAAKRRKASMPSEIISSDHDEILEGEFVYAEDRRREDEISDVVDELGVIHPISYEGYDVCELVNTGKLAKLTVPILKAMCSHFEISYKSKDLKDVLLKKIEEMVKDCNCFPL